jgi:sugar/nucleoside kinase (ribokinase family)
LISFLNWSEIENSSQIWRGYLDEILPDIEFGEIKPIFFSDFSDCSRKSKKEIQTAINLLGRFRKYFRVVLSLNQNETSLVARALNFNENVSDEELVSGLSGACNTDILVVHRTNDALACDGIKYEKCKTFFCKVPEILTGGGDNFNAGFCVALLHDLNLFQSLVVANAVSGLYVKTGISPDLEQLKFFFEQELK